MNSSVLSPRMRLQLLLAARRVWWSEKSGLKKALPLLLIALWWGALKSVGGLNSDHFAIGGGVLLLAYLDRSTESLLKLILPAVLTVIIYDSMRHYSDLIRATYIRVQEPYRFDQFFFGITTSEGILTPNEWFQKHTHWTLDLVTGFFYIAFVAIFMLMGIHFRFLLPRLQSTLDSGLSPDWVRSRAHALFWAFFWTNMLGYSTYYWYPAAPPWYVSLYGLGPADLSALPNPAGCIRFDQLLGTRIFTEMYGRSADVFGAVPSLHVAYPLLTVLFAFELRSLRAFAVFFYLIMCFSAVYLNHHYILDLIWGSAYTLLVYGIMRWRSSKLTPSRSLPSPRA